MAKEETMSVAQSQTAIVTGGTRGLGRGIVEALAVRGIRVVAVARDRDRLAELGRSVSGVVPVAADAADEATAEHLLREHAPDLVVLCAGASPALGPLHEQTWEGFSRNWEVDAKSAFVWLRQALRLPAKQKSHFIVVSSGAALRGSPVSCGYAGAKRTQWFIAEYAIQENVRLSRGLRIQTLLPKLNPNTDLGRAGVEAYAARNGVTPEKFLERSARCSRPRRWEMLSCSSSLSHRAGTSRRTRSAARAFRPSPCSL